MAFLEEEAALIIRTLTVGPFMANCYIVACPNSREAAVIDPGDDGLAILQAIGRDDLQVKYIINTHGHIDHVGANAQVKRNTGAPILIHREDAPMLANPGKLAVFNPAAMQKVTADRELEGGDELPLGEQTMAVIHTPGHTRGGICLKLGDVLFSGDTLFAGSIGRTDLGGGSYTDLMASIKEKLLPLGDQIRVFPGHGPATTLGQERLYNPFLQGA